jgi:hypothetical protein
MTTTIAVPQTAAPELSLARAYAMRGGHPGTLTGASNDPSDDSELDASAQRRGGP